MFNVTSKVHPILVDAFTKVSTISWLVLYFVGLGISVYKETFSVFVSILFFLPFFSLFSLSDLEHHVLKKIYLIVCISTPLYLLLWIVYPFLDYSFLTLVSITFAGFLFFTSALFTWSIMRYRDRTQEKELHNEVKSKSFWLLCTSLGLFLCITYLFSFAFAFHDKYMKRSGNVGLYVNPATLNPGNVDFNFELKKINTEENNEKIVAAFLKSLKPDNMASDKVSFGTVESPCLFHEIEVPQCVAAMDSFRESLKKVLEQWSTATDKNEVLNKMAEFIKKPELSQKGELERLEYKIQTTLENAGVSKVARDNLVDSVRLLNKAKFTSVSHVYFDTYQSDLVKLEIEKLSKIIERQIARSAENQRILITLIGHTDSIAVKDGTTQEIDRNFVSNYELSEARAKMVKALLIKELLESKTEWPNIEWEIIPAATSLILEESGDNKSDKSMRRVDVWVSILPQHITQKQLASYDDTKILNLLDYIYFTVYTITTTGYGDIVPVSDMAKFLTTLVNFVEVFFMVVFFNVLLSFSQKDTRPREQVLLKETRWAKSIIKIRTLFDELRSKNSTLLTELSQGKGTTVSKKNIEAFNQQISEALGEIDDEIIMVTASSEVES